MINKKHFVKINIDDWQSNISLKLCSTSTRCLWFELIILMASSEKYGFLCVNGKPMKVSLISKLTCMTRQQIIKGLKELEEKEIFSRDENGVIFSKKLFKGDYK